MKQMETSLASPLPLPLCRPLGSLTHSPSVSFLSTLEAGLHALNASCNRCLLPVWIKLQSGSRHEVCVWRISSAKTAPRVPLPTERQTPWTQTFFGQGVKQYKCSLCSWVFLNGSWSPRKVAKLETGYTTWSSQEKQQEFRLEQLWLQSISRKGGGQRGWMRQERHWLKQGTMFVSIASLHIFW